MSDAKNTRRRGDDRILSELLTYWRRRGDHTLVPLGLGLLSLAPWFKKRRETESVSADVYVMF